MRLQPAVAIAATLLLSLLLASCGGSTTPKRQLQAIIVSPATASGSAQFIATGMFSQPPSPMQLATEDIAWCPSAAARCAEVLVPNNPTLATIDTIGNAQCLPGARGTMTIVAVDNRPIISPPGGIGVDQVNPLHGQAQLTCP
jgi:hypothetical protein